MTSSEIGGLPQLLLPAVAVVPFVGDERPMPTQDCVGGEQRADLLKRFAAEDLALYRKSPTLVIVKQDAFLSELLLEHLVLGP